ncbi:MAG: hypothetical protein HYU02_08325 [Thaumarchaeota archaeon]|nr:hypothetical protein [Nitrososphaerota archaeon]
MTDDGLVRIVLDNQEAVSLSGLPQGYDVLGVFANSKPPQQIEAEVRRVFGHSYKPATAFPAFAQFYALCIDRQGALIITDPEGSGQFMDVIQESRNSSVTPQYHLYMGGAEGMMPAPITRVYELPQFRFAFKFANPKTLTAGVAIKDDARADFFYLIVACGPNRTSLVSSHYNRMEVARLEPMLPIPYSRL